MLIALVISYLIRSGKLGLLQKSTRQLRVFVKLNAKRI